MFGGTSFRVGSVFGIRIEIDVSWLIIFVMLAITLSVSIFPATPGSAQAPGWAFAVVGVVSALLFFLSILLHELCHALVAKVQGLGVDRITLFIFGGVARLAGEPTSARHEFLMAGAGPLMSLALASAFGVTLRGASAIGAPWWVRGPLAYLAEVNLIVGVFNLLPGFPLDGGRILRSILWAATGDLLRATRWASRSGQTIGWLMVAAGMLGVLTGRFGYLWFGVLGWFIVLLAGQSYRGQVERSRIEGARVRDVMTPNPQWVPGDITLDGLVSGYLLGGAHTRYPVFLDGKPVGLVSLNDVKAVAQADWPFVRTTDVAATDLQGLLVDVDAPASDLVGRLTGDRPGALIAMAHGEVAGIVTRADVISFLHARGGPGAKNAS